MAKYKPFASIETMLLRIIANYSAGRSRYPSVHELEIKTRRSREAILYSLEILAREGFIEWKRGDPDTMLLIQAWETVSKASDAWKSYGAR